MHENPWREAILDRAVYTFLSENEGAWEHSRSRFQAIVITGGITPEQREAAKTMMRRTLGLWWPVYIAVNLLRRPRAWAILVNEQGSIDIREIA